MRERVYPMNEMNETNEKKNRRHKHVSTILVVPLGLEPRTP